MSAEQVEEFDEAIADLDALAQVSTPTPATGISSFPLVGVIKPPVLPAEEVELEQPLTTVAMNRKRIAVNVQLFLVVTICLYPPIGYYIPYLESVWVK